jgi:hypothetical protein
VERGEYEIPKFDSKTGDLESKDFISEQSFISPDVSSFASVATTTTSVDPEEIEEFYRCQYPYIGSGSKGEKVCRKFLVKYFKLPFMSCKPLFLGNPETNGTLELDCYEGSLRLAVEYQGRQHYYYTPFFHKNGIKDFEEQQRKDAFKAEICRKVGVYLIRVPYSVPNDVIPDYIIERLPSHLKK